MVYIINIHPIGGQKFAQKFKIFIDGIKKIQIDNDLELYCEYCKHMKSDEMFGKKKNGSYYKTCISCRKQLLEYRIKKKQSILINRK